jgi:hypothetical protein
LSPIASALLLDGNPDLIAPGQVRSLERRRVPSQTCSRRVTRISLVSPGVTLIVPSSNSISRTSSLSASPIRNPHGHSTATRARLRIPVGARRLHA